MTRVLVQARDVVRLLFRYLGTHGGETLDELDARLADRLREVDAGLAALASQADEKSRPLLERATREFGELKPVTAQVQKYARVDSNNRSAQLTLGPGHKALDVCLDALNALYDQLHGKLKSDAEEVRGSSLAAQRTMLAVPAAGVPVSLVLALLLTRSITRPAARGVEASEAIARGDLTRRLNLPQRDEVGLLTQAMDRAAATFARSVGEIRRCSEGVAGSAADLSGFSKALLAQSEETAGRADQVAAGTEQMSTNINTMAAAAEEMSMNVASISSASEEMSVNVGTISVGRRADRRATSAPWPGRCGRDPGRSRTSPPTSARGSKVTGEAMDMAGHRHRHHERCWTAPPARSTRSPRRSR